MFVAYDPQARLSLGAGLHAIRSEMEKHEKGVPQLLQLDCVSALPSPRTTSITRAPASPSGHSSSLCRTRATVSERVIDYLSLGYLTAISHLSHSMAVDLILEIAYGSNMRLMGDTGDDYVIIAHQLRFRLL